jgi:SAM-dependent methyltransferase
MPCAASGGYNDRMNALVTRRSAIFFLAGAAAAPALAQRELDLEVPYVPTPEDLVEKMLDLAEVGGSDYLIDLGCGDGRIAVAAGRRGARALGVDLDGMRLQQASVGARRAGVQGHVSFRRQDLFATPIHEASVIALYLLPAVNLRLRPRLLTELPAGARVVSHAFDMGDWEPDARDELDSRRIFLWHVPAVAGGSWEGFAIHAGAIVLELEQRYQIVTGTLSVGGRPEPVSGRLRGTALVLRTEGGASLSGQVRDDRIVVDLLGAPLELLRAG